MPDAALRDVVLKRLEKAADENNDWDPLVMAALEGQSELTKQLDDGAAKTRPQATAVATATATTPPRIAFVRSVTVEGFRKSSFAEGLELLLTGETYRWEDRSKVTRTFALEGEKGPCAVSSSRAPVGWTDALASGGLVQPVFGPQPRDRSIQEPAITRDEQGVVLDDGDAHLGRRQVRQPRPDRAYVVHRCDRRVGVEYVPHSSGTERWPPDLLASASIRRISSVDSPAQGPISANASAAVRFSSGSRTARTSIVRSPTLVRTGWSGSRLSWATTSSRVTGLTCLRSPKSTAPRGARISPAALTATVNGPKVPAATDREGPKNHA
jgi:hypothetical protein